MYLGSKPSAVTNFATPQCFGAQGEVRTRMTLQPADFESAVYTSSTTWAFCYFNIFMIAGSSALPISVAGVSTPA